jgi:hypothetical protein
MPHQHAKHLPRRIRIDILVILLSIASISVFTIATAPGAERIRTKIGDYAAPALLYSSQAVGSISLAREAKGLVRNFLKHRL